MTNYNIFYLYVFLIILLLLLSDGGFGFQSFCRLHRWGARTTQDNPYHPTSPLTTRTPSSSPFSTVLYPSRNLQLQLNKVTLFPKGEQPKEIKDWLQNRLDLTDKEIEKIYKKTNVFRPHIMDGDVESAVSSRIENLDRKIDFFEKRLNIADRFDLNATQQLRTFVLRNPTILSRQVDSMEDKLTWYENRFNFPDSEKAVKKIIRKQPNLLNFDVESVDEKLTWLQNRVDLTDVDLYKICQGCPNILILHVDNNLEPQLHFLASRFCLDQKGLRAMIRKMPTIFHLTIDNIESKMEFYEDILGKDDAIRQIGNVPIYLSYSLEGRLKPRLANVTDLGLVVGQDVRLNYLVQRTNKQWEEYMKRF